MIVENGEIKLAVGMEVLNRRNHAIYLIAEVLDREVRLSPKWPQRGIRQTWKSRARLWIDYRIYLGGADGQH